jgi:hypothetical protein
MNRLSANGRCDPNKKIDLQPLQTVWQQLDGMEDA